MPELVVDPAVLVVVAKAVADAASRLDAVAAALSGTAGGVGPDDVAHALEDTAHVWQRALRGVALGVDECGQRLVSAASTYDGVDTVVGGWASR